MNVLQIPLFSGISENEFSQMQACRCMRRKIFQKGEYILHTGDPAYEIGVVLSGSVLIENIDLWGNKSILKQSRRRQDFCRNLRPMSGIYAGRRSRRRANRNLVFESAASAKSGELPYLLVYCTAAQSAAHVRPQQSDAFRPNFLHHSKKCT